MKVGGLLRRISLKSRLTCIAATKASFGLGRHPPASAEKRNSDPRDILDFLLATCGRGRAADLRDCGFGSGGHRRSEIARLRVDDIESARRFRPILRRPTDRRCWSWPCDCAVPRPLPLRLARARSSSAVPSTSCARGKSTESSAAADKNCQGNLPLSGLLDEDQPGKRLFFIFLFRVRSCLLKA